MIAAFRSVLLASSVFLSFGLAFLGLGILRSSRLMVHAFDTGIYLQILSYLTDVWKAQDWSGIFIWPSSVTGESNFLAHHFQPIVLFLLPAYKFLQSSAALLAVSVAALMISVVMLAAHSQAMIRSSSTGDETKKYYKLLSGILLLTFFPAFSARIYFGFAPDILAVPAFYLQAIFLSGLTSTNGFVLFRTKGASSHAIGWFGVITFILSQIWAGACKEVFWIINSWVAVLFAIQLWRFRETRKSTIVLIWAGVQIVFFCWLFFRWMPANSSHSNYYGMNYFDFRMTSFLQTNWWKIFELLFAAGFFAAALRPSVCILGALPGLLIVVLARYQQIQSPTAIYALAFVPFFIVAASDNLIFLNGRKARIARWLVLAAVVASIVAQLPLMYRSVRPAFSHAVASLPGDVTTVRRGMNKDAYILLDGNLQPAFHKWRNVRVILGFIGNPAPLTDQDFASATDVLTMLDVDALTDCREVQPDIIDDWAAPGVPYYDYQGFLKFCFWLRGVKREKVLYSNSRLVHYHLN